MKKLFSLGAAAIALVLSSCADHYSYAGGYGGGYSSSQVLVHSGARYPANYRSYGYYPSRNVYVQPSRSVRYTAPHYRDQRGSHHVSHSPNRGQGHSNHSNQRPGSNHGQRPNHNNHGQRPSQREQRPVQREQRREAPSNRSRQSAGVTMASYRKDSSNNRSSGPSRQGGDRNERRR